MSTLPLLSESAPAAPFPRLRVALALALVERLQLRVRAEDHTTFK